MADPVDEGHEDPVDEGDDLVKDGVLLQGERFRVSFNIILSNFEKHREDASDEDSNEILSSVRAELLLPRLLPRTVSRYYLRRKHLLDVSRN